MVGNKNSKAIELIEAILSQSESVSPTAESGEIHRLTTRMGNAIRTLAPPRSVYLDQMQRAFTLTPDPSVDYLGLCDEEKIRRKLVNIMQALKDDLQSDSVYQSLPPEREGQDTDRGGSSVRRIGAMIGSPGDAAEE